MCKSKIDTSIDTPNLSCQCEKDVPSEDVATMPLGMSKVPIGWPLMAQAFIGFALWAINQPAFLIAFEAETKIKYRPAKNALEKMIDEATGVNDHIISKFLDWLIINHWGEAEPFSCEKSN